jgi:branched-chain amino acid transport system permease protein
VSLSIFLQLILDGVAIGLVYVFMAAGFNLILSVTNVFFIAFGMFYVFGGYTTWALVTVGLPFFVAVVLATAACALGGAVVYLLVMHRLQHGQQALLKSLIAGIMLVSILTQLILILFGTSPRGIQPIFPGQWTVGGVIVSYDRAAIIVVSVAILLGLHFLLQGSRVGRGMRALAANPAVASLHGVNATGLFTVTFAAGLGLAGFAGGLMAPLFGVDVGMGQAGFFVLLIIMLGGVGSMVGSVVAGIILGLIVSFSQFFLNAGVGQMVFFFLVGLFFFFRPQGLFGKRMSEDDAEGVSSLIPARRRLGGAARGVAVAAGLLVLLALPLLIHGSYYRHLAIQVITVAVMGMTFTFGMRAGMINVASAAFWGIGAYSQALLMAKGGLSFWAALPVTLLIAFAVSLALGTLICRFAGISGMIFGIVFASIVPVVFNTIDFFGGPGGISGIPKASAVGPIHFGSRMSYYYLLLAFAVVSVLVMLAFNRARTGRAWLGLASSPRLAVSVGVDPFGYRLINFVVMSVIPALLGTVYASYIGAIQPQTFGPFAGITFLMSAVLGGMGYFVLGSAAGAIILVLVPEALRVTGSAEPIITAVGIILIVMFLPRGVLGSTIGRWGGPRWGRRSAEPAAPLDDHQVETSAVPAATAGLALGDAVGEDVC